MRFVSRSKFPGFGGAETLSEQAKSKLRSLAELAALVETTQSLPEADNAIANFFPMDERNKDSFAIKQILI